MKLTLFILSFSLALPIAAQAQQRPTQERLIEILNERRTCGDFPVVAASYINQTDNRVTYTCGADAEGVVPVAVGLLGLGGAGTAAAVAGIGLAAAAAGGGGGSTPDTQ